MMQMTQFSSFHRIRRRTIVPNMHNITIMVVAPPITIIAQVPRVLRHQLAIAAALIIQVVIVVTATS